MISHFGFVSCVMPVVPAHAWTQILAHFSKCSHPPEKLYVPLCWVCRGICEVLCGLHDECENDFQFGLDVASARRLLLQQQLD